MFLYSSIKELWGPSIFFAPLPLSELSDGLKALLEHSCNYLQLYLYLDELSSDLYLVNCAGLIDQLTSYSSLLWLD